MPSENKITHVIFDMDGLLLDTETRYEMAIGNVTRKFGKEYTFELKRTPLSVSQSINITFFFILRKDHGSDRGRGCQDHNIRT